MRVIAMLPELTRSAASQLIAGGKVTVNSVAISKAGYKLKSGDKIVVAYDKQHLEVASIDLPVIYEDDDCVVIEKPVGLLTHSKGAFNPEPTVASWLGEHIARDPKNERRDLDADVTNGSPHNPRAGIVHRLDRATSGVMICAKSPAALGWLQKQFSQRKVKKTYMAIVRGHVKEKHAIIDMPVERNPKAPATFRVGANGKSAVTEYEVVQQNARYDLAKLTPQTGRTHQLRVHLRQLGHPIVGDTLYGGEPAERLFLHALSLEITLPNHERKTFTASLPETFEEKMEKST